MKVIIKDYGEKKRQEITDLLKIEIERDNDIIEPKKETYLLSLYDWNGYRETKTIKGDSQDLEIYEEIEKQAKETREAILNERKSLKVLIEDMIFYYEASESGTKSGGEKIIYKFKAEGLKDLLKELKDLEDLEAQLEHEEGDDIATATTKEIRRQNGNL